MRKARAPCARLPGTPDVIAGRARAKGRVGGRSDLLRVDALLANATSFAGTGAAAAIAQGYIYWVQHDQPGQAGFGTTVYIDRNGNALDWVNAPDLAIADLAGVAASQLNSWNFVV